MPNDLTQLHAAKVLYKSINASAHESFGLSFDTDVLSRRFSEPAAIYRTTLRHYRSSVVSAAAGKCKAPPGSYETAWGVCSISGGHCCFCCWERPNPHDKSIARPLFHFLFFSSTNKASSAMFMEEPWNICERLRGLQVNMCECRLLCLLFLRHCWGGRLQLLMCVWDQEKWKVTRGGAESTKRKIIFKEGKPCQVLS